MLEKIFIKNYKDVNNPKVRTQYGVLCSVLGIVSNVALSICKMIIGILSGSISIIADGIDNISDCGSSIATLVGFKLASQPPDPEHPFGHERIEYLTGMIISIFIIIIGVVLGHSSVTNIINKSEINIEHFILLVVILGCSIFVKLAQFLFYKRIAIKINSKPIKASSQDSLNDCVKTILVLISILLFKFFEINIDSWFGLIVSIYIVINGLKLVREASSPLIGEAPDKDLIKNIVEKILNYDGVYGTHDLVVHNYGPGKIFATVHVEVDSQEDILESHDMIDNIEREVSEELDILLTIHMDPIQTNDEVTNYLKEITLDTIVKIDSCIKFHDFRIVKGITHTNVLFDIVVPPKYKMSDNEIKYLISKELKYKCEKAINTVVNVIITVDQDYVI